MATICETIEETLTQDLKTVTCDQNPVLCHPGYLLNNKRSNITVTAIFFNALGIIFAIFAAYLIVSTDSNVYLIFWVCYSVLRRLMGKSKPLHMKSD